jgi:DNA (cytosine-5)-methyltransferase 1
MVEINPFCQKVLTKNFPGIPIHSDIKTYSPPPNRFDLVFGGFPCQDVSIAGKQLGVIDGGRSSLFFEMFRIFKESGAKFLLIENVLGLLRNGFGEVLRSLSEGGYDAEWQTISAATLGAPHLRERLFIVAYSNRLEQASRSNILIPWSEQIRGEIANIANTNQESKRRLSERKAQEYTSIGESLSDRLCSASRDEIKPDVRRMDDEFPGQLDWHSERIPACGVPGKFPDRLARLSAIGNSIVPACAAIALRRVLYLNQFFG